jgi:hypothetical protein
MDGGDHCCTQAKKPLVSRVTRCVFEKKCAQNVAKPALCLNYCVTLTVVKSISEIWATFVLYKKSTKVNTHPIGKNSPNLFALLVGLFSHSFASFQKVLGKNPLTKYSSFQSHDSTFYRLRLLTKATWCR